MSVEITIGDTVEFNNINTYMYKQSGTGEMKSLAKETKVKKCITTKVIDLTLSEKSINQYVLLQESRGMSLSNKVHIIYLEDLLKSRYTLINSVKINPTKDYPNKWTEFVDDDKRKIPERLTTTACIPLTQYERVIKKYVPLRRRAYLWARNMWRNFTG